MIMKVVVRLCVVRLCVVQLCVVRLCVVRLCVVRLSGLPRGALSCTHVQSWHLHRID